MKTYPVIFLLLLCGFNATSQIIYDYSKGEFKVKVKPVLTGEFATVKIINVNTFRYKVEMEGKNISYITPVPSELQAIFRLPDQSQSKQNAETGLGSIEAGNRDTQLLNAEAKEQSEKAQLARANNIDNKLAPAFAAAAENSDAFDEAMQNLSNASEQYLGISRRVASIKFTRADLIDVSKQDWPTLEDMRQNLPAELSETQMRDDFIAFNQHFEKLTVLYIKAQHEADKTDDPENKVKVDAAYKLLKAGYDKLNEEQFLNLIRDVSIMQEAMQNDNAFTVVSPPIQMDGDFVHFDVKATPVRVSDLLNFTAGKSFPVDVPAKGGWKADFSVGPAFSIGDNAKNESFDKQLADADPAKAFLVKSSNSNDVLPALVAMIHAYRRSGTQFNWGVMMGVGAGFKSTSDVDASYYLGPTFVLGKQQKIMFSLGTSFIPVNRLKATYKTDPTITYPADTLNVVDVTEKTIKTSFFFALSYNLTNRIDVK